MTHPQLRRLKIHRYEEFVDVPWIVFSPHENVILGINGAGKTRLLRLISAVLNFNYADLLAQDFDVEFELTYLGRPRDTTVVEMQGRIHSEELSPSSDTRGSELLGTRRQLGVMLAAASADHRLVLTQDRTGSALQFDGVRTTVTRTSSPGDPIPWDHIADMKDPQLSALLPGSTGFYTREDDRDFQALIRDVQFRLKPGKRAQIPYVESTGDVPPLLVATLVTQLAYLLDSEKMRDGLRFTPDYAFPAFPGEGAPPGSFLPLLSALGAESLALRPKVVQANGVLHCKGFEVRLKFTSGAEYTDSGLTFGQRRFLLMALLLIFRPSFPAFIDEIDNGLHPRLVEAALNLLSERQSFFTSHNKIVVDYINYDSADDIRRKIHICRRDATGRQTVDTISESHAQEVYEKVAVGIMHTSDVLLVEGLW